MSQQRVSTKMRLWSLQMASIALKIGLQKFCHSIKKRSMGNVRVRLAVARIGWVAPPSCLLPWLAQPGLNHGGVVTYWSASDDPKTARNQRSIDLRGRTKIAKKKCQKLSAHVPNCYRDWRRAIKLYKIYACPKQVQKMLPSHFLHSCIEKSRG